MWGTHGLRLQTRCGPPVQQLFDFFLDPIIHHSGSLRTISLDEIKNGIAIIHRKD